MVARGCVFETSGWSVYLDGQDVVRENSVHLLHPGLNSVHRSHLGDQADDAGVFSQQQGQLCMPCTVLLKKGGRIQELKHFDVGERQRAADADSRSSFGLESLVLCNRR
jgi:hypothetical protein